MTITTTKLYTAEDLFLLPPDAPYELVRGELVEVPPAGGKASAIAIWIGSMLLLFVRPRDLGIVTGDGGGHKLELNPDTVVAPDVGFVRWAKLPSRAVPESHIPVPPDLAVEVKSPTDRPNRIAAKLKTWPDAGVPLIWWVYPDRRPVHVHRLGQAVQELGEGDILDGEDVLPGFRLPAANIFSRSRPPRACVCKRHREYPLRDLDIVVLMFYCHFKRSPCGGRAGLGSADTRPRSVTDLHHPERPAVPTAPSQGRNPRRPHPSRPSPLLLQRERGRG